MRRTMSIHLDRLDQALGKQGVALRRSQVQEVLAAALGHLDSNHLAAAVRQGDLEVPVAGCSHDVEGTALTVYRDPVTGMPFGLESSWVAAQGSDTIVNGPYGGLLRITADARGAVRTGGEAAIADRRPVAGEADVPAVRRPRTGVDVFAQAVELARLSGADHVFGVAIPDPVTPDVIEAVARSILVKIRRHHSDPVEIVGEVVKRMVQLNVTEAVIDVWPNLAVARGRGDRETVLLVTSGDSMRRALEEALPCDLGPEGTFVEDLRGTAMPTEFMGFDVSRRSRGADGIDHERVTLRVRRLEFDARAMSSLIRSSESEVVSLARDVYAIGPFVGYDAGQDVCMVVVVPRTGSSTPVADAARRVSPDGVPCGVEEGKLQFAFPLTWFAMVPRNGWKRVLLDCFGLESEFTG